MQSSILIVKYPERGYKATHNRNANSNIILNLRVWSKNKKRWRWKTHRDVHENMEFAVTNFLQGPVSDPCYRFVTQNCVSAL